MFNINPIPATILPAPVADVSSNGTDKPAIGRLPSTISPVLQTQESTLQFKPPQQALPTQSDNIAKSTLPATPPDTQPKPQPSDSIRPSSAFLAQLFWQRLISRSPAPAILQENRFNLLRFNALPYQNDVPTSPSFRAASLYRSTANLLA